MALIVEDGTGMATAQSYVSAAVATAYHALRGNAAWALATEANQEAALVRACAALDGYGYNNWRGVRLSAAQALDWPRSGAWDKDGYPLTGVPATLATSACEAALVELGSAGALTKKAEAGLSELTIGPITKKWQGSSSSGSVTYPAIFRPLRRLMNGGGGMITIGGR